MTELELARAWKSWFDLGKNIGLVLVAAGVCLEMVSELMGRKYELTIERAHQAVIATLNEETARLSAEAEGARAEIAKANAQATESKLEFHRFKAPRRISASEAATIALKLKRFAGIHYVFCVLSDHEAISLVKKIDSILKDAGWVLYSYEGASGANVLKIPGDIQAGIVVSSGVQLEVSIKSENQFRDAVNVFADELNRIGIATSRLALTDGSVPDDFLYVKVGKKP